MDELRAKREAHIRESLPQWKEIAMSVPRALFNKDTTRVRKLWWQGIPPPVRGRVWIQTLPNTLNITHELFEILVKQADGIRAAIEASSVAAAVAAEQNAAAALTPADSVTSSSSASSTPSVSPSVSPNPSQEEA